MIKYINECLQFTSESINLQQDDIHFDIQWLGCRQETNQIYTSQLWQHIAESFVIEEQSNNNHQELFQQEQNEQIQQNEQQDLNQSQFEIRHTQSSKQLTLREQIAQRLSTKEKKSINNENKISQLHSKSPQNRIRKQYVTPPKMKENKENQINQIATIHKKQFSVIQLTSDTDKKVYIPFQNKKLNIISPKNRNSETPNKTNGLSQQGSQVILKRQFKNGVSHIQLNLYKQ